MRKASKILFLIGGIFAILASIAFLVVAIVEFVQGGVILAYVEAARSGKATKEMLEALDELLKAMGYEHGIYDISSLNALEALGNQRLASAVYFLICSIVAIPAAVLAFICKGKEKPGLALLIVATVLNGFVWNIVAVVGGVLGIVDWAVNHNK